MGAIGRRGFLGWAAVAAGAGAAAGGSAKAVAAPRTVVTGAGNRSGLTIAGERFLLGGEPFQIISGALHYFRVHPKLWRDRLQRLRLMGLNTVETYVAWNVHERRKGDFDFSGWADLAAFVRTAGEVGLRVVVRPGPYACAEWDFGGLPAWLLAEPEMQLRCSDPKFLHHVDRFFDALLPRIAGLQATKGGPIIAVQVENEYGSFGNDQDYLAHVRERLHRGGIDSLLFCCNGSADAMLRGGSLPGTFNTVNFDGSEDPDANFAKLRKIQPHGPLWCTEFWDGWFDHWGESHHTTDPDAHAANIEKILGDGGSINLYMAAGSTNFGWFAGANFDGTRYQPTVTSYDYDAPVGESGELTGKFHTFRAAIGKHATVPDGPLPSTPERLAPQHIRPGESAALLDCLDELGKPQRSPAPKTMEQLGQAGGLVHYRARIQGPQEKNTITIDGLADRALVYLDGKYLGTLDRNKPESGVDVELAESSNPIDIIVDAGGRINFGDHLWDPKGITGRVLLGGQTLFGWESRPLPLDDLSGVPFRRGHDSGDGPSLHRTAVRIDAPADGFLELPGWGKGALWLNGFLLGRYWKAGPQRTLYAPAPLWRRGNNELVALELESPGKTIELRDKPNLG